AVDVTVRQVMNDLPYRPSAVPVRRVQLRLVQTGNGGLQFLRRRRDIFDKFLSLLRCIRSVPGEFSDRVAGIHIQPPDLSKSSVAPPAQAGQCDISDDDSNDGDDQQG